MQNQSRFRMARTSLSENPSTPFLCAMTRLMCRLAVLLVLAGTLSATRAYAAPNSPPRISVPRLEGAIHELVNRERKTQGLKLLAWDGPLAAIARRHSEDMAKRKYFNHNSPEGETFSGRFKRGKYVCALRKGNKVHMGAENIAQVHRYAAVTVINGVQLFDWNSEAKIARDTVAGWMASPGHRANIVTGHWRKEGIGLAVGKDGKIFVTQNFC
jgi:uncharacterized protein YkwD